MIALEKKTSNETQEHRSCRIYIYIHWSKIEVNILYVLQLRVIVTLCLFKQSHTIIISPNH